MHSAIVSIGVANPQYKQNQQIMAEFIAASLHLKPAEKKLLKAVYRATGIEQRYSVLSDYSQPLGELKFFPNHPDQSFPSTRERMNIYKEHALPLALQAIQTAMAALVNFDKSKITHLITVSCTGMYAPGIDIEIVQHLKLDASVKRTAIQFMGCYGAFNALKVADAICKAEPSAIVLVVCVELCTIHFQKSVTMDNLISNSIFADGAAAVLLQAQPSYKKFFTLENFHSALLPQTQQAMAWDIGDQGFDLVLSSYVPEMIGSSIAAFVKQLLRQYGPAVPTLDFYAIHPGGMKILQACEQALQISKKQNAYAYQVLRSFGNMSSPTVLFVLKAIWDGLDALQHQKTILSCAFGPGLTCESMILKTHYQD
jgi:predicted naringenin-chalcone synthase